MLYGEDLTNHCVLMQEAGQIPELRAIRVFGTALEKQAKLKPESMEDFAKKVLEYEHRFLLSFHLYRSLRLSLMLHQDPLWLQMFIEGLGIDLS